jgi:hypothetical protein
MKVIEMKIKNQSTGGGDPLVWDKSIGVAGCYQLPRIGENESRLSGESSKDFRLLKQMKKRVCVGY